tara:strand:- start:6655 stop:8304 length:1650 start_codon:yes stop_codon:yes gene_type:complete
MSRFIIRILILFTGLSCYAQQSKPPNILFVISDDQSFAHTSFAGSTFVNTPAFDRVAKNGIYFENCIAGSPGCAPSRSSIVTGRYPWQNEQSGQHGSSWMKKYIPFVDVLEDVGYKVGRTGKGVDPFQYARNAQDSLWRKPNAAGPQYSNIRFKDAELKQMPGYAKGIDKADHVANFKYFIEKEKGDKPFFFWFGSHEPHRPYEKDSYKRMGKKLEDVKVPGFLPDNDVIRGDMLDYAVEIEWFDHQLGKMLDYLEEIGELENTIVIVTADNGKPFPGAKANAYEYGIHVPMAISFPKEFQSGIRVEDPVSFVSLAPTILEIAGGMAVAKEKMMPMTGKSFLKLLKSKKMHGTGDVEEYVFSGRERHSSSRYKNWGYPQRAIRSKDFLMIWNMKPERWPAGAPQKFSDRDTAQLLPYNGVTDAGYQGGIAFNDIDESPSKEYLMLHADDKDVKPFYTLAVGKRPEYELFDIHNDPYCLHNLSGKPAYSKKEEKLKKALQDELEITKDPRVVGPDKEVFDGYERYMNIRRFPEPSSTQKLNNKGHKFLDN